MQSRGAAKKSVDLKLDPLVLAEATALGVNLTQAAEAGLRHAVAEAKAKTWQHENAEALASSNAWSEAHGLPLERYRQF